MSDALTHHAKASLQRARSSGGSRRERDRNRNRSRNRSSSASAAAANAATTGGAGAAGGDDDESEFGTAFLDESSDALPALLDALPATAFDGASSAALVARHVTPRRRFVESRGADVVDRSQRRPGESQAATWRRVARLVLREREAG